MTDPTPDVVEAIRQCRVLSDARFAEMIRTLVPRYHGTRGLARELLRRRWLTPFQINRLWTGRGSELLVGSYVLEDRLGQGGMGQVFRARNWKLGRTVALKLLRKDLLSHPTAPGRFLREIEATARLDHPNIIRALDAGESPHGLYIVMEYVEGTDLGRLVERGGPLSVRRACDYVRQAALALQHAHEKGVTHRDLKPSNLMCNAAGDAVTLLDLGLARVPVPADAAAVEETRLELTQLGVILGTIDYIAPEQARDSRSVDIRADIYSLGCTFHYLLTGRPPFSDGTPTERLLKHSIAPRPSLKGVPPVVVAVVHKMMATDPAARFQTPAAVAAVLEKLLARPERLKARRPPAKLPTAVLLQPTPPEDTSTTAVWRPTKAAARAGTARRAKLARKARRASGNQAPPRPGTDSGGRPSVGKSVAARGEPRREARRPASGNHPGAGSKPAAETGGGLPAPWRFFPPGKFTYLLAMLGLLSAIVIAHLAGQP